MNPDILFKIFINIICLGMEGDRYLAITNYRIKSNPIARINISI